MICHQSLRYTCSNTFCMAMPTMNIINDDTSLNFYEIIYSWAFCIHVYPIRYPNEALP